MRFIATHYGGIGHQTWGVWDVARQEWRSTERLSIAAAEDLAAELNLHHSATGARPDAHRRTLVPPQAVEVNLGLEWRPGQLRYWIREPAGWFGYTYVDVRGESAWYPAERLRLPTSGAAEVEAEQHRRS